MHLQLPGRTSLASRALIQYNPCRLACAEKGLRLDTVRCHAEMLFKLRLKALSQELLVRTQTELLICPTLKIQPSQHTGS